MKNLKLKTAGIIYIYLFIVIFILALLFDYKLHGLVKWYQKAISPVNKITEGRISKLKIFICNCVYT